MPLPLVVAAPALAGVAGGASACFCGAAGALAAGMLAPTDATEVLEPAPGAPVYCDMLGLQHSGIYLGGFIAHMTKAGRIRAGLPSDFLWSRATPAIYTICEDATPVGSERALERALSLLGAGYEYDVTQMNCNTFVGYCLTGSWEKAPITNTGLKQLVSRELGGTHWRSWDRHHWVSWEDIKEYNELRKAKGSAASLDELGQGFFQRRSFQNALIGIERTVRSV